MDLYLSDSVPEIAKKKPLLQMAISKRKAQSKCDIALTTRAFLNNLFTIITGFCLLKADRPKTGSLNAINMPLDAYVSS